MHREFGFNAVAVRLRNVEDEARRAAAGIDRFLKVLDIVVECRRVERDAVLRNI